MERTVLKRLGQAGISKDCIARTIAAGIAHLSVQIVGPDTVIDLGHDASITLTGVTSLAADHLLFI
jgi:hypothetical protein